MTDDRRPRARQQTGRGHDATDLDGTRQPAGALELELDATVRSRSDGAGPTPLDPTFRAALREHLQQTVSTAARRTRSAGPPRAARRSRWSRRRTLTLGTVLAVGLAGGGVAVASGVLPLPGAEQVVLRTPASTAVHTGTATVDLGERPDGVTSVELTLTCLSAGTFTFADGASLSCAPEDAVAGSAPGTPTPGLALRHSGSAGYTLPLTGGQTSTTITATDGTRWSLTTAYSTRTPTDWAVNANGQTYGVPKDDSEPDLIAVATDTRNGEQGYVRADDLNPPQNFTSPEEALAWQAAQPPLRFLPVYAADGVTVIGEFAVG